MPKRTLLIVAVMVWSHAAAAATFRPIAVERFFVAPDDEVAVLRWRVEPGAMEGPLEAVVRDYASRPAIRALAPVHRDGTVELKLNLRPGFYEIELPSGGQRFGVMALARSKSPTDPFFSIDAAMSWLVRSDELRGGMVKALKRAGVAMARERLNWDQINPAKGTWECESPMRYETLRKTYAAEGVDVLEMFHNTTRWAGAVERYPDDLVGTAQAWREIGRRWRPYWDAMEVWNEPDIFFGGNLPADQYVPLVRTLACAFEQAGVDIPLVGGVVAHYNRQYLDCAARNGLLELVDVASFHTYGRAPGMEGLIANYRSWLAAHGREAMPLWITECGRPWRKGPDRAPADQDAESALDITMKAVESKACGIARYFAFVYPFYEENENNFGMMGREGTPLRSMAAYARAAAVLAQKRYLGDLQCDDASVQRARLFDDDRQAIAVVYTGRIDPQASVKLGLAASSVEGIDGRPLDVTADGAVPVPDGLAYVWLDRQALGDRLRADTPAMKLWSIGGQTPPKRTIASPIVLRYQYDASPVDARSEGYHLRGPTPEKMPLVVRVFNLAPKPCELKLELSLSGEARVLGPAARTVSAPAEGWADVAWEADLRGGFAGSSRITATVAALAGVSNRLAMLSIDLLRHAE